MPTQCPTCNGTGREPCSVCNASGHIFVPGQGIQECKTCNGNRYVPCSGPGPH